MKSALKYDQLIVKGNKIHMILPRQWMNNHFSLENVVDPIAYEPPVPP